MSKAILEHLKGELQGVREAGLYKSERVIASPQDAAVRLEDGNEVVNFCANNYLGLSNHPKLVAAAQDALETYGYGMSSVRFICGTQTVHRQLETRIAAFLGMGDAILYSSCFDANTGLFETLLGEKDAIISDALNHASIIDGVRLCKARRLRYANNDMAELETRLQASRDCRFRLIVTDGVFSMDGVIANLAGICDLADKYDAAVMVDDSHAVGFVGKTGRGTHEYNGVMDRVDILTGTFGKALGGASGGYTSARKEIVDLLRQRSRPYLFSNTLAPAIAATSLTVLEMLTESTELRDTLEANTNYFRDGMAARGFDIPASDHPIVPILLGDATLATGMASAMLDEGIYVIGFCYPVVPQGKARIRVQISAGHTTADLDKAMDAFAKTRDALAG